MERNDDLSYVLSKSRCQTDATDETSNGFENESRIVKRRAISKDVEKPKANKKIDHRSSLPMVDVEPMVLRRCQSPACGVKTSVSGRLGGEVLNKIQIESVNSFGSIPNHSIRKDSVAATDTPTVSPTSSPPVIKRRESAPDLSDLTASRPRIIIRLTSVDGLELNLTSPRQEHLLHPDRTEDLTIRPVRPIRCGAARPQSLIDSSNTSSLSSKFGFNYFYRLKWYFSLYKMMKMVLVGGLLC